MQNEKFNLKLDTHKKSVKSKFSINPQNINLWLKKNGSNSIEKGNGDIVMMGCMVMFG